MGTGADALAAMRCTVYTSASDPGVLTLVDRDMSLSSSQANEEAAGNVNDVSDEGTSSTAPTSLALSPAEVAILSELKSSQLLEVVNKLKSGSKLPDVLQEVAAPVSSRVQKAMEDQYATLGPAVPAFEDVGNTSLDAAIDSLVGCGIKETATSDDIYRIARVTPLRLTFEERVFLRLLESTLDVSEYTDKVDVVGRWSPAKHMANQIKHICAILSGLVVAHRYDAGQRLIRERAFKENAVFFRSVFEIGRRYKILNPERMRDSYGKLIYFLMDTRQPQVMEELEFDCVAPVKTVGSLLARKKNGIRLLKDPLLRLATAEIMPEGKSRRQIQWEIEQKESAIKTLAHRYSTERSSQQQNLLSRFTDRNTTSEAVDKESQDELEELSAEEIEICLYSLCDHNTFLRFNREPCDKMISYLHKYFKPQSSEPEFSLAISAGSEGSRLSHSHERQFNYVLQSLTLWREVLHDMLGLWGLAEMDLLAETNPYNLQDTGQGLNRVQDAPHVYRSMYRILTRVQEKLGGWCGSSVIHLGDHNVPNAFLFIDKYVQVPRILGPIVLCLEKIPELAASTPAMRAYIDKMFGGETLLIKTILADFFRHAFDGSGADNFYDAGSCIDGRLTSAWNWCSQIEKKPYFPIFLLTGFSGFDGRF